MKTPLIWVEFFQSLTRKLIRQITSLKKFNDKNVAENLAKRDSSFWYRHPFGQVSTFFFWLFSID